MRRLRRGNGCKVSSHCVDVYIPLLEHKTISPRGITTQNAMTDVCVIYCTFFHPLGISVFHVKTLTL